MFHARVIDQLQVDFARFLFAHGSIPDKAALVQCSDYNRDLRLAKWGSGSVCTAAILRRSKNRGYSITSSAATSNFSGTVIPSVFAVIRLSTRSNLVGCSTGSSAGLECPK